MLIPFLISFVDREPQTEFERPMDPDEAREILGLRFCDFNEYSLKKLLLMKKCKR